MAVEWNKLADTSELNMRNARHNLYLRSDNGLNGAALNMLRPAPLPTNYTTCPMLQFSTSDTATTSSGGDDDVKYYTHGAATTGDDTETAYIDMPGDRSLSADGTGVFSDDNDNLIEDFMGCTFAVPLGDPGYAQHDFDISVIMSQESASASSDSSAYIAFTLWRADTTSSLSIDSSTMLRFRLVKQNMLTFAGANVVLPNASNSMKHQTLQPFSIPVANNTAGDNWSEKMCYYMVGCWVSGTGSYNWFRQPQTNGINWPNTYALGHSCSMKMSLNVAYKSPHSYVG